MASGDSMMCARCGATLLAGQVQRDRHGRPACPRCPADVRRALALSDELRALVAALYASRREPSRLAFAVGELEATEESLGSVIPDAVMGLLLASAWSLGRLVGLTDARNEYARVVHGPELGKQARRDLIVFDTWGDWPTISAGYRPTRDRSEPPIVIWDWKKWAPFDGRKQTTVASYLRDWLTLERPELAPLFEAPVAADALAAFHPVLEEATPLVAAAAREVQHPKFGRGRVIAERGDKLEIDFGEHGVRTLLARFVTDAR